MSLKHCENEVEVQGKIGHRGNHLLYQVSFVEAGGSELGQVGETPKSNHEGCPISLEQSMQSTATAWKPELDHCWGCQPQKENRKSTWHFKSCFPVYPNYYGNEYGIHVLTGGH